MGTELALPVAAGRGARRRGIGYSLYLAAAVLFGINGTVSKVLLLSIGDAARVSQLRVTAAFLLLLGFVALTRPHNLRFTRAELPLLAAYGVLGVAMTQWLYFVALTRLPVGIALLIEFTAPILVVLWVRFGWRRPVGNTLWLGLALALIGLSLVAQVWNGRTLSGLGVLAASGAAAALALYYVLGEVGGLNRDSVWLTMWGFGFAAAMWALARPWWSFPWSRLAGSTQVVSGSDLRAPLWLLACSMIVLGTIAPFWLVLASINHIGAAGASIVGMSEPFVASLVAWVMLGEVLTPTQLLGGAVILTGVVVAERARTPRRDQAGADSGLLSPVSSG